MNGITLLVNAKHTLAQLDDASAAQLGGDKYAVFDQIGTTPGQPFASNQRRLIGLWSDETTARQAFGTGE